MLADKLNKKMLDALTAKYNKPRAGLHASDLIYCPRRTCFRKLDPQPVSNAELNFFTSGKAIEMAVVDLLDANPDEFDFQKHGIYKGISYSIDAYWKTEHVPIECKSYRGKHMDKPKAHYVEQLEAYMALTDSDAGIIMVQCLLEYDKDAWQFFEHYMTREERTKVLLKLEKDAKRLQLGLDYANPAFCRHIAYDENFIDKRGVNWTCKNCHWLKECEEMRSRERTKEAEIPRL